MKWFWFCISALVAFLDQITKYFAVNYLTFGVHATKIPILYLTLTFNSGSAWGFLHSAGDWHKWFFSGINIFLSLILIIWIIKTAANSSKIFLCSLSLILGGAIGNLIDRMRFGSVIDFIYLHYKAFSWPVFNVADIAICIGAFLLFFDLLKKNEKTADPSF